MSIVVSGSGFSQGGQAKGKNVIDSRCHWNKILLLEETYVVVESGVIWKDLIDYLNKRGRSVKEMQSYVNFSVGGSISVNCHGRGMGTISETIEKLWIIDETKTEICLRPEDPLFRCVVGGYGAFGIITKAQLSTTKNCMIHRTFWTTRSDNNQVGDLIHFFAHCPSTMFYNGLIYPGDETYIHHILWKKTDDGQLVVSELQHSSCFSRLTNQIGEQFLRRGGRLAKFVRAKVEPKLLKKPVISTRNAEMMYDVQDRTPYIHLSLTWLQEYFLPVETIDEFLAYFLVKQRQVNMLNMSLRYVYSRGVRPFLDYAPTDRIALVIYYNLWSHNIKEITIWTQEVLDVVLRLKGTFYLPYRAMARPDQVAAAYPQLKTWQSFRKSFTFGSDWVNQVLYP